MTETQQTTAERIAEDMGVPLGAAQTIAAEIDAQTAEIARLTAEVAALRPAAKGWETLRALYEGQGSSIEYAYSMARVAREASKRRPQKPSSPQSPPCAWSAPGSSSR